MVLLRILLRSQTRIDEGDRRERQRAYMLGLVKIPGADGKYQPKSEER